MIWQLYNNCKHCCIGNLHYLYINNFILWIKILTFLLSEHQISTDTCISMTVSNLQLQTYII